MAYQNNILSRLTSVAIENNFFAHRRPKSKPLLEMSVNPLHLFAADPYHPPGYAGYVPQKMYRHAGTYGRTTHDILKGRDARTVAFSQSGCRQNTRAFLHKDERVPYKITRTGKLINFFKNSKWNFRAS